ncbi:MAG: hypothetical protein NVS1B13_07630 [Flavisolibacter sp.]
MYFNYNYNETERKYLNDSTYVPPNSFAKYVKQSYLGRSHFAEVYTNYSLVTCLDVLLGIDYRLQNSDQNYFSVSDFGTYQTKLGKDSLKMNQTSVFASFLLKGTSGLHLEIGGRYNHHSIYGNNITYSFNPSYNFSQKLKIFANLSSGFKAPTLYQLYGFGFYPLKPERSKTFEGGTQVNMSKNSWLRAVYFKRHAFNYIDYNLATNNYFNYNRQQDQGFEIETAFKTKKISFSANYTYLTGQVNTLKYKFDPSNYTFTPSGDTSYNNLFRRPKNSINASIGFQISEKAYVSANMKLVGKRTEPIFGDLPLTLPAYQTVNIYLEYFLCPRLKVFGDFKNITNTKYFEIRGYNSRRFNFMAGIIYKLD